jgi:methionyl-tRNA formyltransferase
MSNLPSRPFIFFGEDAFSLVVLESLINAPLNLKPIAVVMLEPISVSGQRLASYCQTYGITLIKTTSVSDDNFLSNFEKVDFDLTISAHFQRILPAQLFNRARIGGVNLHPSLLPKYRGMSPQHWPIVLGDANTGVTVHYIDEGVDTGRILRQVNVSMESDIYIHELQKKFLDIYKTIMVDAVECAIKGDPGQPQSTDSGLYFHKVRDEDMEISLKLGVNRAYGQIRAFSFPYAGARFQDIKIMKAIPVLDAGLLSEIRASGTKPGLWQKGDSFFLIFEDGALEVTKWRNA